VDADAALRLLVYFVLLLMSGFFSGSETALFSLSPVQLMRLEEEQHPSARLLKTLLDQPRRLIATIFIGNEFVNIGASALMASFVNRYLAEHGSAVVAVVSTLTSVSLILLLGEITPKNIAARLEERWAIKAARPIWLLAIVMAPLRIAIERIADAVVHLVGRGKSDNRAATVGEEEFRTMVDVASRAGDIDDREKELIENVFDFGDRRIRDIMVPVSDVFMLPYDLSLSGLLEKVRSNTCSRIPIYRKRRDKIVGVLHAKDLIAVRYGLDKQPLSALLHPAYYVPAVTKCEDLLREFRRRRIHLAMAVDEYGNVTGLVTMEDLLEELFGEIKDEKEMPPPVNEIPPEVPSS
jgi:putative hemolysin